MPIRLLALGDSYTIGEAVSPADSWPVQLVQRLRARGIPIADPVIIAATGWTTAELAAAIETTPLDGPFSLVTLLIGVNDQYRGLPCDHTYRQRIRHLLKRAIALAGGEPRRVLVLSIPDWSITPFASHRDRLAISTAIQTFNAANHAAAQEAGAASVDITPLSRLGATNPELLAADGLHPSPAMYRRWVELILPLAHAILSENGNPP